MFGWFVVCCIVGLGEAVITTPYNESLDHGSDSNNSYTTDVIAFGHVTLTSVDWQTEYNDTTSTGFQEIEHSVSEMVLAKVTAVGLDDVVTYFQMLLIWPRSEGGIGLTFYMVLKIDGETDIETVLLDVAEHLNEIENFENATVTENFFVGEYPDEDHSNAFLVVKVHGHVTFTSQQWQTGFNDNSSEEFRMLNYNVTKMILAKAHEEELEDDVLDFKVQSAMPGGEGVVLTFLLMLRIENDTDDTLRLNVTKHLNDIENLQNTTVTDTVFVDEYQDKDQEYANEDEGSADHMDNYSVIKVQGRVTFTSQQWHTGFNDNSSEEFRMLNYNVTEMILAKAQEEELEDDVLDFKVQSAMPGGEGVVLTFLLMLRIEKDTNVETLRLNVTKHLNDIENLQNTTVTDTVFVDDYQDNDQEYANEDEGSADHMDNYSVIKVQGRVTFTSQQWHTGFNDNSSEEFRMLNYNVTEMILAKAQEEKLEDDVLDFKIQSAMPGGEGVVITFLLVLRIENDTDVETLRLNVTKHLNDIENLQNATVTDTVFVDDYQDKDQEYATEDEGSADHMDNYSVIKVHGRVTFTSQQWHTGFNDNSSEEFRMLNYNVTEMILAKAQEEELEDDVLDFKVQSAMPGGEGVVLTFLLMLRIENDTNVETLRLNVTKHLNDIENLQNATVTDTVFVDDYQDKDQEYANEDEGSADHMDNYSVIKVHGRITFTPQQWHTGFNDNSSEEFRMLNYNVTEMVLAKAQEEELEDGVLDFKVQSALPGGEGVVLIFLLMLRIENDTDVETLRLNVTKHLNDIENLQNATVTDTVFVDDYQDKDQEYANEDEGSADHMDNYSVIKVHGHVTFTSQQWHTGFYDNSSEEFRMLNDNVTDMVLAKAQEEELEDDVLDFKVQSAMPGGEGVVLTFLLMLRIENDTDVESIPLNVTKHLNDIENLQNATVTEWFLVDELIFQPDDNYHEYSNEYESSADHMDNSSVDTITQLNVTFTTGVIVVQAVPKLALYCNYETETEYEYMSKWYADDETIYTSARLPGDNIDSAYVISDDVSLSGFALEKIFKCSASVYRPEENNPVLTKFSQEIRLVEFEATEFEIERGRILSFGIQIGIPLPCQHGSTCYVDIKLIDPDEDSQCQDSALAFINTYTCGQRIMGSSNYSKDVGEILIKMTTRNDQHYELKSQFKFLIKFEPKGEAEDYWRGIFTTEFTVQVNDNKDFWKTMSAFSINDPRICVHGYICFSLNQAGDFLFYRNKQDRVEVQIATEECLWGGFCTCGVIVRAGKDVYMIDHCSKFHTTSYLSSSGNSNLYIREDSPGYYKIFLPRGTMVTVGVLPPALFDFAILNVGLFPSPYDVENVEGLCGDVSYSNWAGLVHSDGSTTPVDNWWLGEDPVNFINSWSLSDTESLWYMLTNEVELEDLDEEGTMCVCTGFDDADDVFCSKHEKRLCVDDYNVNSELPGNMKNEAQLRKRMQRRNEIREAQIQTRKKREVGTSASVDFETAFDMCRSSMNNKCGKVITETDTELIANNTYSIVACAYDKMENSSVNWEDSSCIDSANKVKVLIDKDPSLLSDAVAAVEETLCPNLCSRNGDCINKKCSCHDGFKNDDCGVQSTKPVTVESLGNGECDVPCNYIYIQADGITSNAVCRIYHKQINTNNEVKTVGYIDCLLHYESAYEARVEPRPNRRRRSTDSDNSNIAAEVYEVSVSNDGSTFGSSSEVIALDTTCLTYHGTGDNITLTLDNNYCLIDGLCYLDGSNLTGQTCKSCDRSLDPYSWTLHSDYCLIDEVCYPNGTLKSSDTCKFCLTTADPTDWTTDNKTDSCVENNSPEDSGIEGHVIAIIVLTVLLVLGGAVVGGYFLLKKYQASRAMGQGLFDNVKRPKFSLRIEPTKTTLIDHEKIDHPPPDLYQLLDVPRAPTDTVPGNLYTERENGDQRLPEPILPNVP